MEPGCNPKTSKQQFYVTDDVEGKENAGQMDDSRAPEVITHIRLNAFPDGGIARLRLYGYGMKKSNDKEEANLASANNGYVVI